MRVAAFYPVGGAGGDMILGALLDAGLDERWLRDSLQRLSLPGYKLTVERVTRSGIQATRVTVVTHRPDTHHHDRPHRIPDGPGLEDVTRIVGAADLPPAQQADALRILGRLVRAEAEVAGISEGEFRFHPVVVVDTMIDVVGAVTALAQLGVEDVMCAALPLGGGTIRTRHGEVPRTSPVTRYLVEEVGFPVQIDASQGQQVTRTAAAILTSLARPTLERIEAARIGFGAGSADLQIANVLEVRLGDAGKQVLPPASR